MAKKRRRLPAPVALTTRVTGIHVLITPVFKAFCEQRLSRLLHIFPNIQSADVELRQERGMFIAEITLKVAGLLLRSQEKAKEMRAAVNAALGKLERQLKRYKGKLYESLRKGPSHEELLASMVGAEASEESDGSEASEALEVVRVKRIEVKPMPVHEAALQMELLGHSFFFFINEETQLYSVLYKRQDGGYGLIEPEV